MLAPSVVRDNTKMVQAQSQTLTLEEFLQLPETKPASEYIDGQIIQNSKLSIQN